MASLIARSERSPSLQVDEPSSFPSPYAIADPSKPLTSGEGAGGGAGVVWIVRWSSDSGDAAPHQATPTSSTISCCGSRSASRTGWVDAPCEETARRRRGGGSDLLSIKAPDRPEEDIFQFHVTQVPLGEGGHGRTWSPTKAYLIHMSHA